MKTVEIRQKENGYVVRIDGRLDYVYTSVEVFKMLEFIGKHILGGKIKVTEN